MAAAAVGSTAVNVAAGEAQTSSNVPEPVIALLLCAPLTVAYTVHVVMLVFKRMELAGRENRHSQSYGSYSSGGLLSPSMWSYFLSTIMLPLGIAIVSRIAFEDSDPRTWANLAYTFAIAVFIVMITLEISTMNNLISGEWRPLLNGALSLDLLSLLAFSLMGIPAYDSSGSQYAFLPNTLDISTLFLFLTGLSSLLSSFLTLHYTRVFDMFAIGDTRQFKTTVATQEVDTTEPKKDEGSVDERTI